MLSLPAPAQINGGLLEQDLAAEGMVTEVFLRGDQLVLVGLDESHRDAVVAMLDTHALKVADMEAQRVTEETNGATLRDRATSALQINRDFRALNQPTNAQVLAQVRALTQQNSGIIRLMLNRLDATD